MHKLNIQLRIASGEHHSRTRPERSQGEGEKLEKLEIDPDWWDSIDMADAMHPQTFLAYGMNGDELPVGNGGPLRPRVARQLGYKSVKFITHLTVTYSLKGVGKGSGSVEPESGYA